MHLNIKDFCGSKINTEKPTIKIKRKKEKRRPIKKRNKIFLKNKWRKKITKNLYLKKTEKN